MLKKLINKIKAPLVYKKRRKATRKTKSRAVKNSKTTSRINSRLIFILLAIIMPGILIFNFVVPLIQAYANFGLETFGEEEEVIPWSGDNRLIVLGVGLDAIDSEHKFVDALMMIVLEPESGEVGLFGISPDINVYSVIADDVVNIRTLYNLDVAEGREVEIITEAVENLLAVRVDRYLLTDKQSFSNMVNPLEPVAVNLVNDVKDDDVQGLATGDSVWGSGLNIISSDHFLPYLASDVNGLNDQLHRQVGLVSDLIKNADSLANIFRLPVILKDFSENLQTNMSKSEFINFARSLMGIRSDQIKIGYTRTESLIPAGKVGIYPSYSPVISSIDRDMASILYDFNIAKEQARVEVLNGSGIPGIAGSRSRWITNAGSRVVYSGNAREDYDKTTIFVDNPEDFPHTLYEIERVFNNTVVYSKTPYKHKHIGDIIIAIGSDVQ